jgi:transcriptional regulator with XRE-family HTH domain
VRSITELNSVIATRLKGRRERLGLSLEQVAAKAQLPLQQVTAYEAGAGIQYVDHLIALCDAVETPMGHFIRDFSEEEKTEVLCRMGGEETLLSVLNNIPRELTERLRAYAIVYAAEEFFEGQQERLDEAA